MPPYIPPKGCLESKLNSSIKYPIAYAGTEEMWIETDETPYLYYTGPNGRYNIIHLIGQMAGLILVSSWAQALGTRLGSSARK